MLHSHSTAINERGITVRLRQMYTKCRKRVFWRIIRSAQQVRTHFRRIQDFYSKKQASTTFCTACFLCKFYFIMLRSKDTWPPMIPRIAPRFMRFFPPLALWYSDILQILRSLHAVLHSGLLSDPDSVRPGLISRR